MFIEGVHMKKYFIMILLFCFILAGCVNKNNNESDTMTQPTIEGEYEVNVYNLKFFIPKELTVNSYNGINNTYDYYIEKSDDNCEAFLTLINSSKYDNSMNKYMNEYVKVTNYNEELINNTKWYQANSGNNINYSTIIGEYFYNVRTSITQSGTICSKVNDMIKSTLFVAK